MRILLSKSFLNFQKLKKLQSLLSELKLDSKFKISISPAEDKWENALINMMIFGIPYKMDKVHNKIVNGMTESLNKICS